MGSKRIRMLSGFNHNILYKGKTYHIQTEDGGLDNPSIVTHAFLGGVILDTVRQGYDDLLGRPDWEETLRGRMKAQHLEEIRKLFSGAFEPSPEEAAGHD
ncbi:MAG TPA: hypothetical protein DD658_02450 [Deltaproteobacteria bacterium]|nr:MAG: hypothetical protein A2X88_07260 [Deltaproteobacteria bacterium GWC2_65_14]HBO69050.1 hypothetical protein [Deltaproteobacteria bacterium]